MGVLGRDVLLVDGHHLAAAAKSGTAPEDLPVVGREVTGNWLARDVIHIIPFEELEQAELEGEENDEEEKEREEAVGLRTLSKKK